MKTKMVHSPEMIKKALLGTGISIITLLALAAGYASLISSGKADLSGANIGVKVILILAALAGSVFSGRGQGGIPKALISGVCFLILLICVNSLVLTGTFGGVPGGTAAILVGALLPSLLNRIPKKSKTMRRRKKRIR